MRDKAQRIKEAKLYHMLNLLRGVRCTNFVVLDQHKCRFIKRAIARLRG